MLPAGDRERVGQRRTKYVRTRDCVRVYVMDHKTFHCRQVSFVVCLKRGKKGEGDVDQKGTEKGESAGVRKEDR